MNNNKDVYQNLTQFFVSQMGDETTRLQVSEDVEAYKGTGIFSRELSELLWGEPRKLAWYLSIDRYLAEDVDEAAKLASLVENSVSDTELSFQLRDYLQSL